jgi:lipase
MHLIDTGDLRIAAFEWGAELRGEAPAIVLAHATGFHARCWDETIRRLGDRHVIAIDQRGHGRSDRKAFSTWTDFSRDLVGVLEALGISDAIGVGHSMGGHATVGAAANTPALFERLVLIDPVILAPDFYASDEKIPGSRGEQEHPTARRRDRFASAEEMIERFESRRPFSLFTRQALHDYCKYGLLPAADGSGMQLACAPEFEASIYVSARSARTILEDAERVQVPVTLVRAMEPRTPEDFFNFEYSPTWPELASRFPDARDLYIPELTHFIPMQDPERSARIILEGS